MIANLHSCVSPSPLSPFACSGFGGETSTLLDDIFGLQTFPSMTVYESLLAMLEGNGFVVFVHWKNRETTNVARRSPGSRQTTRCSDDWKLQITPPTVPLT